MHIDHIHALPPGTRFEEYRLDSVLGAGGFGITYRAYASWTRPALWPGLTIPT